MAKIGLFYASSTGNTEDVAKTLKAKLDTHDVDMFNLGDDCDEKAMDDYTYLILGASTWGEGDLQDDWEDYLPNLDGIDFSDKTVALFGLGDQEEYCDNFLDALGTIYDKITEKGANVVGFWPTEGYEHDESTAIRNDEFVGLALDEDNQDDLSEERISEWVNQITPYFVA
ncbi:MAG: flavodoxin [Campylobacterota bacterium]|nr:flavodoxin [Campylobacterota bacterium]